MVEKGAREGAQHQNLAQGQNRQSVARAEKRLEVIRAQLENTEHGPRMNLWLLLMYR